MKLDNLDQLAVKSFEDFIVRKDLLNLFRTYSIPTYVIESLLRRHCANTDEAELQEGLKIVRNQLHNQAVTPVQFSQQNVLDILNKGRAFFTLEEWKDFLIRSVGMEPTQLSETAKNVLFVRMIPFIERNYNMIELGPRGTGKSHLYQQFSPYSQLISSGKVTNSKMFVNRASNEVGFVCNYDLVCMDEIQNFSFDQEDGLGILKNYMGNGEFNQGKKSIIASSGIVMLGNIDRDVENQKKNEQLFSSLSPKMKDDTAFMDRIHAFVPGWEFPKLSTALLTNHFGLGSDFLAECFTKLRNINRITSVSSRIEFGAALSYRDTKAVNKTLNGLLKLMQPNPEEPISEELLEWAIKVSLEYRRRVKEQQKKIRPTDFENTDFSYRLGENGIETFVTTPEIHN